MINTYKLNSNKLVSVIIPFKNRTLFLEDTIQSVFDQTYRPIEILLINDHSERDEIESAKIIISKFNNDKSVELKLFNSIKNGAPAARNFGFENSQGEFIQFLDSDDVLLPNKITNQINIFKQNPEIDLVYSKAQFVDENLVLKNEFWGRKLENNYKDYFEFSYQTMCPLYKKNTIKKFGVWDEKISINQDWEFCLRYIIKGAKTNFLEEVSSYFRVHSQGNIGNIFKNPDKLKGKWISTFKIFTLIEKENLFSKPLKKLFYKRFLYIYSLSSSFGFKELKKSQWIEIKPKLNMKWKIIFIFFSFSIFSKLLHSLYNRV